MVVEGRGEWGDDVECLRKRAKGHLTFIYSTRVDCRVITLSSDLGSTSSSWTARRWLCHAGGLHQCPWQDSIGHSFPLVHSLALVGQKRWFLGSGSYLSITRVPTLDSACSADPLMDGGSQCGDLSAKLNIYKPIPSDTRAHIGPIAAEMVPMSAASPGFVLLCNHPLQYYLRRPMAQWSFEIHDVSSRAHHDCISH